MLSIPKAEWHQGDKGDDLIISTADEDDEEKDGTEQTAYSEAKINSLDNRILLQESASIGRVMDSSLLKCQNCSCSKDKRNLHIISGYTHLM